MNKSETIKFNGVDVTCHEDGSVEWTEMKWGKRKRTFGYNNGKGYMKCQIGGKQVRVHRLISIAFDERYSDLLQVDHINGLKSDNRPSNLRMVTGSQNMQGSLARSSGCSSKFRGVSWSNSKKKWLAAARINGVKSFIGLFTVEADAASARDAIAYANGYQLESLNMGVRKAQNLLLCLLAVSK